MNNSDNFRELTPRQLTGHDRFAVRGRGVSSCADGEPVATTSERAAPVTGFDTQGDDHITETPGAGAARADGDGAARADGGWRIRRVTVRDLTFDLAEQGVPGGRPVLLLHGFPQTHRAYDAVAARLAASHAPLRLLAPDQRGYSPGARPADPAAYALPALAADMVGLLDACGIEHVDVVGHDWGAMVGWYLAARYPERVRTLTAVSVPHPAAFAEALAQSGEQRRMSEYVQLFRDPDKAVPVLLEDGARRLRALYQPLPDSVAETHVSALGEPQALRAALNWYRAAKFGQGTSVPAVEAPTVFVWSTGDIAISRAAAERCVTYAAGPYRFVELEGVSHWIPDEAPGALVAAFPFPTTADEEPRSVAT
jgi:pimeloyl-ACP methyl ester carboxylesterase